jgi:hypothetical protein
MLLCMPPCCMCRRRWGGGSGPLAAGLPTRPDHANHHRRRHPLRLPQSCITLVPDRPRQAQHAPWPDSARPRWPRSYIPRPVLPKNPKLMNEWQSLVQQPGMEGGGYGFEHRYQKHIGVISMSRVPQPLAIVVSNPESRMRWRHTRPASQATPPYYPTSSLQKASSRA